MITVLLKRDGKASVHRNRQSSDPFALVDDFRKVDLDAFIGGKRVRDYPDGLHDIPDDGTA